MNDKQLEHVRDVQYSYYYELAKKESYINVGGLPYKHASFVHATLAEFDPINYNKYGMTDQLKEKVIDYAEEIAQTVSDQLKMIPATITGNIIEDTQSRNQTLLELEEIVKQEFVERVKADHYTFVNPNQKVIDTVF